MADTKLQKLQRWQTRTEAAIKLREEWEVAWRVEELERAFLGKLAGDEQPFWVNLMLPAILTQKPALLPRTVSWLVRPKAGKKAFSPYEAQMQQGVLTAIAAQDDHLFQDARLAIHQAFFRIGVLKASYDPRFEKNPEADEPITDVFGEDTGTVEPKQILTDEVYRWEWIDARHMILPDQGASPRRWTWIGEEITVPLMDAQDDPRFRRGLRSQLIANATSQADEDEGKPREPATDIEEEEHAMFTYIEVWDILNKEHCIWAEGQPFDEFLLDEDTPEGIEDHPYALLAFLPLLGPKPLGPSPWPLPLTFNWLPLQEQHDILAQMVVNNARRAARKFGYTDDTFADEEDLEKMTSPIDMQGVRLNNVGAPPVALGESSTNPDVTQALLALRMWWRELTGATGTRLGDPDADTATEAVMIEQSATLRDSDMRLIVDKWLARAGAKMLQLVKETLTLDMWVQFRSFNSEEMASFLQTPPVQAYLAMHIGAENVGSVANFDFGGKIQNPGLRNSIAYRPQNSRKSKFATEPNKVQLQENVSQIAISIINVSSTR